MTGRHQTQRLRSAAMLVDLVQDRLRLRPVEPVRADLQPA